MRFMEALLEEGGKSGKKAKKEGPVADGADATCMPIIDSFESHINKDKPLVALVVSIFDI